MSVFVIPRLSVKYLKNTVGPRLSVKTGRCVGGTYVEDELNDVFAFFVA